MTSSSEGSIRLGGLSSGFDTESIIDQMLASDQGRIDRLKEKKEINKAKIQTWEDISEQFKLFAETVTKLRATGTGGDTLFDNKSVSSSNQSVVSSLASYNANVGSYELAINNIARSQVLYGAQKSSSFTVSAGSFIINGTTITTNGGETLDEVANLINIAGYAAGEEVVANVIDDRMVLQTKNTGASFSVYGSTAGSPPFTIASDDPNSILQNELEIIDASGNFINTAQTAADADLSINGVPVTSSSNTIDDAISGVTFNLHSTGNSTVSISYDTEQVKATITDFVDIYNETRDLITRIRTAKLDEDDAFGLFSNDSLLRQLFNSMRSFASSSVSFADGDWDGGSPTVQAASAGSSSLNIDNLDASASDLYAGDTFHIIGDNQAYTLTQDASVSGGSASIQFYPPLQQDVAADSNVRASTYSLEEIGVGTRTDSVSGIDGVLGIIDAGKLDSMMESDMETVKRIFNRYHASDTSRTGVARKFYDWIDSQIKISPFLSKKRSIEDIAIPGLEDRNENIDAQVSRLEDMLESKRTSLVRKFAEMENSISESQSIGASLGQMGAQS